MVEICALWQIANEGSRRPARRAAMRAYRAENEDESGSAAEGSAVSDAGDETE